MHKSVITDQQDHLQNDENETLAEIDIPRETLNSPKIFDRFLNWLASLILLTEEEQKDAGIYLNNQRYR
jgi:hypothetical protein